MSSIAVRGASEHNLRDVSIDIPKNRLIAFTGVSGSGKSSLVFDTIYVEAFRRFADASHAPVYVMGSSLLAQKARPRFRAIRGLPPALGLSQSQGVAGKLSTVGTICGMSDLLRVYYAAFGDVFCRNCDIPLRATTFTQLVDRILAQYAGHKVIVAAPVAEKRKGGFATEIERFRQLGFSKLRVNGTVHDLQDEESRIRIDAKKLNTIDVLVDLLSVAPDKRKRLERAVSQAIEYGKGVVKIEPGEGSHATSEKFNTRSTCPQCGESAPRLDPRYFSHSSLGQCTDCGGTGAQGEDAPADLFPCSTCKGTRLSPERPIVRVRGQTYEELQGLPLGALSAFVGHDLTEDSVGDRARLRVTDEVQRSLSTMLRLGLGHLSLNRSGMSLPPGDLQRLRLGAMLSNRLTGALYVLDEPCQGLTAAEVQNLIPVLKDLVVQGATVLVVEHHPEFLKECDLVYTMGPGAGIQGGHVTALSSGKEFFEAEPTLPPRPRAGASRFEQGLRFSKCHVRTLKMPELAIPQGGITILRGQAGKGKTSFLELCLLPALEALLTSEKTPSSSFCQVQLLGDVKVTHVNDVRPGTLTRTSRRSVAAALEIIVPLRELYAQLPASQVLGQVGS